MDPEFGRKTRSWVEQQIAAQLRFFMSLQWSKIEVHKICTEMDPEFGRKTRSWVEQQIVAQLRFYPVSAMEQTNDLKSLEISRLGSEMQAIKPPLCFCTL
jgi:hypothetical protein